MWHKTNIEGPFAGVKSETFSKGSLNHTASLAEGLHGEARFPFSRPISGRGSRGGRGRDHPGCGRSAGRMAEAPVPPAHGPRHRNSFPNLSWRGPDVLFLLDSPRIETTKALEACNPLRNSLNGNHKAWKFKGFGKNAALFFMSRNRSSQCLG